MNQPSCTMFTSSTKFAAAVATAFILSGCSGEPSSGEIKQVVEAELKPMLDMQAQLLGGLFGARSGPAPSLKEVNKLGCKPDGDNAYRCDVELVMSDNKTQNLPLRFVKGSKGWVLSQ